MNENRFTLDTGGMIPRWFVVLWDSVCLLIVTLSIPGLREDLSLLAMPAIGFAMIVFAHIAARGFSYRGRHFVELGEDRLRVNVWLPFRTLSASIPYSLVDRIEENVVHTYRYPFGWWPFMPIGSAGRHVDIRLRRLRFLGWTWGRVLPWARVIHLQLVDPDRFVSEIRHRMAAGQIP